MAPPHRVQVLDDLLPPELKTALFEAASWMPMYFLNRRDRYKTHDLDMHWYYPVAFSDQPVTEDIEPQLRTLDDALQPIARCWDAIKAHFDHPVRLYECMLSANTFGTEGSVHQDIDADSERHRHHTALVYCNKEWDVAWAGETLVFDADRDLITSAVRPKPGRVMVISGDPPHVGRSVSRICPTDRRVLVYKFWAA